MLQPPLPCGDLVVSPFPDGDERRGRGGARTPGPPQRRASRRRLPPLPARLRQSSRAAEECPSNPTRTHCGIWSNGRMSLRGTSVAPTTATSDCAVCIHNHDHPNRGRFSENTCRYQSLVACFIPVPGRRPLTSRPVIDSNTRVRLPIAELNFSARPGKAASTLRSFPGGHKWRSTLFEFEDTSY